MRCFYCGRVIREYRMPGRLSSYRRSYEPCPAQSSYRYELCSVSQSWVWSAPHNTMRHEQNNPRDVGRARKQYVRSRVSRLKQRRRFWLDYGKRWRWSWPRVWRSWRRWGTR